MALAPLAAAADLTARNITVPAGVDVDTLLASASSKVREAAGAPITTSTVTVLLAGWDDTRLDLPGAPARDVTAVTIDGVAVTDWRLVDASWLYRSCGWRSWCDGPSEVSVSYTCGAAAAPADIVDLVCSMVSAAAAAAEDGAYGADPRVTSTAIDDYRETRVTGADATVQVMDLPERTRLALRARFGGSASIVVSR